MIQSTILDQEEIRQEKRRFWLNWTMSSAIGMSIGWCLGEYLGQLALNEFGLRTGEFVAALVFELTIWAARILPSEYFSKQQPLKFLDKLIWFGTEVGGWIIFSFVESRATNLTSEVNFIFSMGVTFWIVFAVMGLLKVEKNKNPPDWFSKAFIYALLGFGLGNMFVVFLMTTAMSINYRLGEIFNPYIGWSMAGLFLGGSFGAVTGIILVRMINWNKL
ncbi:MAG: hypothetical protein HZB18_01610 [Chloroflexi bacterium]|nr:hypothetical protein [Chloroflexota bacterium]